VLGEHLQEALLFKQLATLRTDAALFGDVEALRWRGPAPGFAEWTRRIAAPALLQRALKAQAVAAAR
jgi:hypothetical protein